MHIEKTTSKSKISFHPLTVSEVRRETRDAVSIRFDVPDHLREDFKFQAGQYLTLKADINGEDVRRNYSICTSPVDGELRIAVKALPGGRFSTFVNEVLRAGDVIEVMPASGHFTAPFGDGRNLSYAAFAAGSGITPILSIIKTVLKSEPSSRFTLFYGNRSSSQILFLEELSALKNRCMDRLELYHFLSAEDDDIELFNGRLDADKCRDIVERLLNPLDVDLYFICGPEGMMSAAEEALRTSGVAQDKILLERFLSAGSQAGQTETDVAILREAAGRKLGVLLDGRKSTVTFDAALGNILDSVRAAGMSAPYACKGGVCSTCRARVIAGQVDMKVNYGLTPAEVAQGYILTCQATPRGDDVLISYDI
jgi:ring-1,2-phenylacetyl-CoA epoxidase subunit PaaE